MTWNVLRVRSRRPVPSRWERTPVLVRQFDGCVVIEVCGAIGPAREAQLGRLLHWAIRPGGTGVLVDLRRAPELGVSGISVLRLAGELARRRGLPFGYLGPGDPRRPHEFLPVRTRPTALPPAGSPAAEDASAVTG
ncbi:MULTISPECIES: STAS domain-containing protein [Streptomyces]|uniref:STAS domain-containing protein n=1 Tax=Streptomyces TaxID=1883 RepID=UPI002108D3B9|nr:hypothetical protein [Streptomyces longispororuber]MCQ4206036.1 hypothetical protein [Streptomyces longispororuber]